MDPPTHARPVRRLGQASLGDVEEDHLVTEEPLEIRLNGVAVLVTMRTPGDDEELALGFLHNEGVLDGPDQVHAVEVLEDPIDVPHGNVVDVACVEEVEDRAPKRLFHATSACGICGLTSIRDVRFTFDAVPGDAAIGLDVLRSLPDRMRRGQRLFDRTGGLHAAALFTLDGDLLCIREDVGRHNAVDKVVGWAFRQDRLPLSDTALAISGRAGFEILQKAVAAGIPVVGAVGAASHLAAALADEAGVTLAGFLTGDGGNVYTHPERILP